MAPGDYINDRSEEERRSAARNLEGSWLSVMAAGLGVIALGAVALRTRLSSGGDTLSALFNFLGLPRGIKIADVAANTGKSTPRSNTVGIRSAADATIDANRNVVNLGPIDIVDDLRNTTEILGNTDIGKAEKAFKDAVTEYVNREQVNAGNHSGYFTQGLERVTFKQVLEDQNKVWSTVLGTEQWEVLDKARKAGIISDSQILDKNIYLNTKTQEILDLRKRNLFSKVVPVQIGEKEVYRRVSRFDMFGQASVLADILGARKGVVMLSPGKAGTMKVGIKESFDQFKSQLSEVQEKLKQSKFTQEEAKKATEEAFAEFIKKGEAPSTKEGLEEISKTIDYVLEKEIAGVTREGLDAARSAIPIEEFGKTAKQVSKSYPRVFIGGKVYGYAKDSKGQVQQILVAEGRAVRRVGGPLEMIDASRRGDIGYSLPDRKGVTGKILNFMEKELGIGTAFGTRDTFIERFFINPYKRFKALASGEGVAYRHQYRREIQPSKTLEAALGGEIPEMMGKGGGAVAVKDGGKIVQLSQLTPMQRIGVLFDFVEDINIVKKAAAEGIERGTRTKLGAEDIIAPRKKGAAFIKSESISPKSDFYKLSDIERTSVTEAGSLADEAKFAYYDVPSSKILGKESGIIQGLKDFLPYSVYRLNSLFSESLLGIAMKPDHRMMPLLARAAMIPVAYEAGRQVLNYADYLTEKFTGISPTNFVASLYAGARVAQQKLRELTGIRAMLDFTETYFPGSVNSDGSTIARSVIAPAAVASKFLGKGNFFGALAGAFATYFAVGGPDPTQEASDLIREYKGEKKVPVRKGRLWGLGYLPFFGGKPERYDYSWYTKLTSDYKMKSMYGSEQEYWSYHANVFGIPLPTPSNLFGLLNILNPYRLESKQYYQRPYEQTGSDLRSFPIFGPVLEATVGQLVKPTFYREPEETPLVEASLAEKGLTASYARLLGIPSLNATSLEAEDPNTAINLLLRQANIATEPLGVYKFALEFFGVKLKPEIGTEKATSAMMTDIGRGFYDANVGGLFGQTEMLRRFILSDYSSDYRRSSAINTIPNTMPDWLPGKYSASKRDQSYFIDFTSGDPFVKIEDGEARLPGPGYEALNKLYSGEEGVYSDVDRFLILADVAPYSQAYKTYEKKVLNMELDDEWKQKIEEAIQNRKEVIGVDTRYKRYEEDIVAMNMGTISSAVYAPLRKAYDFLTHDVLAEIPYVGSKFFPFRSPYEQYRKMYVEGSEYASWDRPYEDIIRPAFYDIALEDPATAAGKGAAIGFLASGPMSWFTPFKSIIGQPSKAASLLTMSFNPESVKMGAMAGAALSASRIVMGESQDVIPSHIQREQEAIDYMDKIAYIKGRMLEEAGGSPRTADKTLVGARNVISYRAAMPRSADRRYFDYFLSMKEQGSIPANIEGLPEYMARGISYVTQGAFPGRASADQETLDFINNNPIPDSSWAGWNPEVSAAATKLKFIQDGINGVSDNIHRFGFYESHEMDLKTRLREFSEQQINYTSSPMYGDFDSFIKDHTTQVSGGRYKVRRYSTPYGARREVDVKQDREKEVLQQMQRILR